MSASARRSLPTILPSLLASGLGVIVGAVFGLGVLSLLKFSTIPLIGGVVGPGDAEPTDTSEVATQRSARPTHARRPSTPPEVLPTLVSRYSWPAEPPAPTRVDRRRFADAMELLCRGRGSSGLIRDVVAPAIVERSVTFGVDPFLVAALVSRRGCRDHGDAGGFTGLAPELYASSIRQGMYRFAAYVDGRFEMQELDVSAYRFDPALLRTPDVHFHFVAAFLSAWEKQHRGLDVAFAQAEHRHYVSHFLWGDAVGSARQENWILIERRRILEYYDSAEPAAPVRFRDLEMSSPLDGAPRLVVSGLGEPRGNGTRSHRGVDFESSAGEPVRAVADGTVVFSGVDLPGTAHRHVDLDVQGEVDLEELGHGGFYVCVEHRSGEDPVKTCYMHLLELSVRQGRVVRRGEEIGQVGSTGSSSMGPHLHFEVHAREGVLPATEVLRGLAIGRSHGSSSGTAAGRPSSTEAVR